MADRSLEEKIQRALDFQEIQNLVSRYTWKVEGGRFKEVEGMFAKKTLGVRAEMLWGVYEGTKGINKLYSGLLKYIWGEPPTPGQMFVLPNSTAIIEIAGDGKTAKVKTGCIGHDTWRPQGKLQAFWTWGKRAIDFVKEDGKWKIWHYHEYGGYYTTYEKGWIEDALDHPLYPYPDEYPAEFKPDKPPTTYWEYKPDKMATFELALPLSPFPYETFDEKTAF